MEERYTIAQHSATLAEHARRIELLEERLREQGEMLASINSLLAEIRTEMRVRNEFASTIRTMVWAVVLLVLSEISTIVWEALR